MDELEKIEQELFDAIKHGDEEHQAWLKDALHTFFADRIAAARANLYTMDQMRDYADSFHASREKMRGEAVPNDRDTGGDIEREYYARLSAPQPQQAVDREFKNFHRLLCERLGYSHDEVEWKRDQVSLIEWIAKQVQPQQAVPDYARPTEAPEYLNADGVIGWTMGWDACRAAMLKGDK